MLNYNHLYYFHVAATEGSLSAAAAKLGVKQSTVSEQLRSLEQALHRTLFERTSTGMRLTAAGQVAYEHTTGSFQTRDDVTLMLVTHTATFKRRGITAAARTGVQGALGPFTFELLAEVAAVKLDRGTYVHEVESPGLSDDELGYAGSLMLGVKLQ